MFRDKNKYINASNWLLLSLVLATSFLGCTKVIEPDLNDFGLQYYPTSLGDYRIYYTKTIRHNLDGSIDTTQYLVKEVAEDSVIYSDGNARILLGRYSREIAGSTWQKDSIWAVLINNSNIIMSEANTDFVKLSFPVLESKKWDGNATNSNETEYYELVDLENSYAYDTLTFENTLTVVQKDLLDPAKITEDDYRIEVYAADVGLIHKLKIKINYCSNCVENGKIEDGFIFEQKLIEFGKE